MTSCWRGRGVPARARSLGGSFKPLMEGLQPWPKAWGPDFVQCSRLREAHSAHSSNPNSQRTSQQGAFLGGNKIYKVVAWMLQLFPGL